MIEFNLPCTFETHVLNPDLTRGLIVVYRFPLYVLLEIQVCINYFSIPQASDQYNCTFCSLCSDLQSVTKLKQFMYKSSTTFNRFFSLKYRIKLSNHFNSSIQTKRQHEILSTSNNYWLSASTFGLIYKQKHLT